MHATHPIERQAPRQTPRRSEIRNNVTLSAPYLFWSSKVTVLLPVTGTRMFMPITVIT